MRIVFLHIGDLHIKDRKGVNGFQIKKIADTLNDLNGFDQIIIIITGDVAFSGSASQYKYSKYVVGDLIKALKDVFHISKKIDVICVPGNHDVNHCGNPMSSHDLQAIYKGNQYNKYLPNEIAKQKDFVESFAMFNGCFKDGAEFCRRNLEFSGFRLEVNMINSGLFSILEEDKGLHYISQSAINELVTPTGADFVISVMHHAPEWYNEKQKHQLEEALYKKSSILFLGHEHYIGNVAVEYHGAEKVIVQAGGCLCENDAWEESSFHVGVFDTVSRRYEDKEFKWNQTQQQYEQHNAISHILPEKPSVEQRLIASTTYLSELKRDPKHVLSDSFLDYFVFPRLESEDKIGGSNREFTSEGSFVEEILSRKIVHISGGYNSGKTALLKYLFLTFQKREYAVLLCDSDSISGKSVERIIKNCFQEIYGDSESAFSRFQQTPKSKKVLIIDDIDQIRQSSFDAMLSRISEIFEYIIFASKQILDFNILDRMKTELKASDSVYRYRIMPCFSDKRQQLVEKVVSLKITDSESAAKTTKTLSELLTAQRQFISLDPDFIIKYVECYCNNISEATGSDSGIFSKVFEAGLTNAVSKYQTGSLSVDKVFALLSNVAYFIHFNKAYPISEQDILSVVVNYNDEYGDSVKGTEFIWIGTQSQILVEDKTGGYRFESNNYLAYFVATKINQNFNETGDDKDLQEILKNACFGINADILLFLSYITNNVRVLRLFLHMAKEYTKNWEEFDFENNSPLFLREERQHIVSAPQEDAKQQEMQAEITAEKSICDAVQTVGIYDYTDNDLDVFVNQIIRAVQLIIIIARCLPNFEHNMRKTDKEDFVQAIYSLPNKVFYTWACAADKGLEEIVQFFKSQPQEYYIRQKKASDEDIIRVMQWTALSFLLDLYNFPVFYSTKENTINYLSQFCYKDKKTYEIEHLMMLERQASPTAFAEEALRLEKEKKGHLIPPLIARVVGHAIVYRQDLPFNLVHQLEDKFYPSKESKRKLDTQRIQNKRIENG